MLLIFCSYIERKEIDHNNTSSLKMYFHLHLRELHLGYFHLSLKAYDIQKGYK